jgi:hypothetical protein
MICMLIAGLLASDPIDVRFSNSHNLNGDVSFTVRIVSKVDRPIRVFRPIAGPSVYTDVLCGQERPTGQVTDYNYAEWAFTTVLQSKQAWSGTVRFSPEELPVPYDGKAIIFRFVYSDCMAAEIFREANNPAKLPDVSWGSWLFIAKSEAGKTTYSRLEKMSVPISDSFLETGLRLVAELQAGRGRSHLALYSKNGRMRIGSLNDLAGQVRIDSEQRAKDFVSLRSADLTWHLFDDRRFKRSRAVYWNLPEHVAKTANGYKVIRLATDTKTDRLVEMTEAVSRDGSYRLVRRRELSRPDVLFRLDSLRLPEGD